MCSQGKETYSKRINQSHEKIVFYQLKVVFSPEVITSVSPGFVSVRRFLQTSICKISFEVPALQHRFACFRRPDNRRTNQTSTAQTVSKAHPVAKGQRLQFLAECSNIFTFRFAGQTSKRLYFYAGNGQGSGFAQLSRSERIRQKRYAPGLIKNAFSRMNEMNNSTR